MFRCKFAFYFAIVAFCIASSEQRIVFKRPQYPESKHQGSLPPRAPIGYYRSIPDVNGYRYHIIGKRTPPVTHYPFGWPYQTYQRLLSSRMQSRNEQLGHHLNARGLDYLTPSLYSQYQSAIPQVYGYPQTHHFQPYEYSTPVMSGLGHYSGFAGIPSYSSPYLRNPVVQSSVPFDARYLHQKSNTSHGMLGISRGSITTQFPSNFTRSALPNELQQPKSQQDKSVAQDMTFKVIPASFGYPPLNEFRKRGGPLFENKHQPLSIPNSNTIEGYQHLSPLGLPHTPLFTPSQMNSGVEESKPMNWNQWLIGQPLGFKSAGMDQKIENPDTTSMPKSNEEDDDKLEEDWHYETLAKLSELIDADAGAIPKISESTLVKKQEKIKPKLVVSGKKKESNTAAAAIKNDEVVGAIFGNSFRHF